MSVVQHTEGRGQVSNAMLDLSVSGLANVMESVGGWLGVDGAAAAGAAPPECRDALLQLVPSPHSYSLTKNLELGNMELRMPD